MAETVSLEQILENEGVLVYKTQGVSMEPMLRQNRDLVEVKTKTTRLKPMDVALYKAGSGRYILHRVIKVTEDGYLIRGDNTIGSEQVKEEQVIGVLVRFVRKGKQIDVTDFRYRVYANVRQSMFPVRRSVWKLKQKVRPFVHFTKRILHGCVKETDRK